MERMNDANHPNGYIQIPNLEISVTDICIVLIKQYQEMFHHRKFLHDQFVKVSVNDTQYASLEGGNTLQHHKSLLEKQNCDLNFLKEIRQKKWSILSMK